MGETLEKPAGGLRERLETMLAAPRFHDEQKDRLVRILNIILLSGLLALLLILVATIAAGQYERTFKMAAGIAIVCLLLILLRNRLLRLTILLTFVFQLGMVTWILFTGGGIHELATMLYPITIVIAGLLLKKTEFLAIFILSMLSAAFIIFSELNGVIDASRLYKTSIYVLLTVMALFILTAVAVRMLANDLLRSQARVQRHQQELKEGYTRLQQEVQERQHAEEALRESETRFRTLAESTFEGVCISEQGIILDANPSLARMLGCAIPDIVNRPLRNFLDPRLADIVMARIREGGEAPWEHQLRRADGVLFPVESRFKTIPFQGRMVQVTTCLDISERRRSEEEQRLLEAEIRQSQKLDSLGTLAGGIAHDFNNIISIIGGHTALLAGKLKDNREAQTTLNTISEAAERGSNMVRQILTFARKAESEFRELHIQEMIGELVKMLRVTFPRTIEISHSCPSDLPAVWMDPSQIHQALLNLCINARDAMAGTGKLEIRTSVIDGSTIAARFPVAAGKRLVHIRVSDTGVGMDEKTRSRIFEPFFSTKGRGRGTGLGLAVVYGVVQSHKGFIEVDSAPGQGTSFSLYFPVSERQSVPEPDGGSGEMPLSRGNETVLVVEDEEDLRELLATVLHDHGYTILVACDGLDALERYRRHRDEISLIITDMDLPKINGAAVSQSILGSNPGVRIILISGFVEASLKNSILASGVREFMAKPYTMPEMLQMVRKVLDRD